MHEWLGAQVRIMQTQIGTDAGSIAYVIEHVDGSAYGQFIDKLNSDGQWQQLVASFQKDPPAEAERSNLLQDIP